MSKIDVAIFDLQLALKEQGLELEMIKINKPLVLENMAVETIGGVRVTDIIYEDDITHWKRTTPTN